MTLTLYQLALIAGGFTVLGVLLGAWLANYFAERRDDRNRIKSVRSAAALKLLSVIAKQFADIRRDQGTSHLTIVHAALLEFLPYLNTVEKQTMNDIWERYKHTEEVRDNVGFFMPESKKILIEFMIFIENHEKTSS